MMVNTHVSLSECLLDICEEYKYAGVSVNLCRCDNHTPWSGTLVEDNKCHQDCPGDHSQYCGGPWPLMAVWERGMDNK